MKLKVKAIIFIIFLSEIIICYGQNNIDQKLKRPNILICIADDVSFPHMGAYGTKWIKTPGFDSIAGAGILFMKSYTPNAKCAPSRSVILTGGNSWQLEAAANHWPYFPQKFKSFMEVLSANGYHTGYTGKGWGPGKFEGNMTRYLTGKSYNDQKLTSPASGISNIDYTANFERFLSEKGNKPFCFWYGGLEPHRDYEYGAGIKKGRKSIDQIDRVPACWPSDDSVKTDMLDYAFEIEWFDRHLRQMLNLLKTHNELDNTIVIVTADNGMPFPRAKGQSYEVSNHVPLAIMWIDGIKQPGRSCHELISFIDIAPTIFELAGLSPKQSTPITLLGNSLMNILEDKTPKKRDFLLIGKERHDVGRPNDAGYPMRGIIQDNYLLIKNYEPSRWPSGNPETGYLNTDGGATKSKILNIRRAYGKSQYWDLCFGLRPGVELYNVNKDPDCTNNLALDKSNADKVKTLTSRMEIELRNQGDPRMFGKGYIFDLYPYADDTGKDFYNRYMRGERPSSGWVSPGDFEKQFSNP